MPADTVRVLIIVLLVSGAKSTMRFAGFPSCSDPCNCTLSNAGKVVVKCNLTGWNITEMKLKLPTNIYRL